METLQDPSLVFGIPIIGYQLPDGSYLENTQLEPDIKVANAPETVVQGEDTQLKVAVDELLKEIDEIKCEYEVIKSGRRECVCSLLPFLYLSQRISLSLFGNHQIIILLSALNQQVFFIQQVGSSDYLVKGI